MLRKCCTLDWKFNYFPVIINNNWTGLARILVDLKSFVDCCPLLFEMSRSSEEEEGSGHDYDNLNILILVSTIILIKLSWFI